MHSFIITAWYDGFIQDYSTMLLLHLVEKGDLYYAKKDRLPDIVITSNKFNDMLSYPDSKLIDLNSKSDRDFIETYFGLVN